MKTVLIEQYGGRDQLKEREVPKPVPQPNQVVIEIYATSINPIDWKVREGHLTDRLPFRLQD
jgi:NADPH:quinone reductase-like Zn-dependent oxidoreductase